MVEYIPCNSALSLIFKTILEHPKGQANLGLPGAYLFNPGSDPGSLR
jgi:hypothetical protein